MRTKIFKLLLARPFKRIAAQVWIAAPSAQSEGAGRSFNTDELEMVLEATWTGYAGLAAGLPNQPNLRTWLVMNFACLTLAAQRAMIPHGFKRGGAIELIAAFTWHVTSGITAVSNRVTKGLIPNQMRRLEILVDLLMRMVFSTPAYQVEKGDLEEGFFMDVHTCPVADYLLTKDAADLCISAWCGVDFGLVEIIGGRLERTGTRAMGNEKCDFKFFSE